MVSADVHITYSSEWVYLWIFAGDVWGIMRADSVWTEYDYAPRQTTYRVGATP